MRCAPRFMPPPVVICSAFSAFILFFFFSPCGDPRDLHLSLHDALPIFQVHHRRGDVGNGWRTVGQGGHDHLDRRDRKSTRLNSSHLGISYAVFCLKKKKNRKETTTGITTEK